MNLPECPICGSPAAISTTDAKSVGGRVISCIDCCDQDFRLDRSDLRWWESKPRSIRDVETVRAALRQGAKDRNKRIRELRAKLSTAQTSG